MLSEELSATLSESSRSSQVLSERVQGPGGSLFGMGPKNDVILGKVGGGGSVVGTLMWGGSVVELSVEVRGLGLSVEAQMRNYQNQV